MIFLYKCHYCTKLYSKIILYLFIFFFQAREKMMIENALLKSHLDICQEEKLTLKCQIGLIRQHTILFILNQMNTLHMQKESEV